jgi:hypothetical protein
MRKVVPPGVVMFESGDPAYAGAAITSTSARARKGARIRRT